jgi:hypothetical protein
MDAGGGQIIDLVALGVVIRIGKLYSVMCTVDQINKLKKTNILLKY